VSNAHETNEYIPSKDRSVKDTTKKRSLQKTYLFLEWTRSYTPPQKKKRQTGNIRLNVKTVRSSGEEADEEGQPRLARDLGAESLSRFS
jgi:hypothetical protein